jgi:hypothetical protein
VGARVLCQRRHLPSPHHLLGPTLGSGAACGGPWHSRHATSRWCAVLCCSVLFDAFAKSARRESRRYHSSWIPRCQVLPCSSHHRHRRLCSWTPRCRILLCRLRSPLLRMTCRKPAGRLKRRGSATPSASAALMEHLRQDGVENIAARVYAARGASELVANSTTGWNCPGSCERSQIWTAGGASSLCRIFIETSFITRDMSLRGRGRGTIVRSDPLAASRTRALSSPAPEYIYRVWCRLK